MCPGLWGGRPDRDRLLVPSLRRLPMDGDRSTRILPEEKTGVLLYIGTSRPCLQYVRSFSPSREHADSRHNKNSNKAYRKQVKRVASTNYTMFSFSRRDAWCFLDVRARQWSTPKGGQQRSTPHPGKIVLLVSRGTKRRARDNQRRSLLLEPEIIKHAALGHTS